MKTIGSSFKRKKKSSPYGPYLPATFHCVEAVRSRTLSQASRKGHRTPSHNGSTRPDTTLLLVSACLAPTRPRANFNTGLPRTLMLCPRHQVVFEVLFPQLRSRFISAQNVIFANRIAKLFPSVLGCFHGPQGFFLLSLLRFLSAPTSMARSKRFLFLVEMSSSRAGS